MAVIDADLMQRPNPKAGGDNQVDSSIKSKTEAGRVEWMVLVTQVQYGSADVDRSSVSAYGEHPRVPCYLRHGETSHLCQQPHQRR